MSEEQFKEDILRNPLRYIGKTLRTKEGKLYVVIGVNEGGIQAVAMKPMGG